MRLVEILESRKQALRVSEVATLFAVTSQHIYKMTAKGMIPSKSRILQSSGHAAHDLRQTTSHILWRDFPRTHRPPEGTPRRGKFCPAFASSKLRALWFRNGRKLRRASASIAGDTLRRDRT